MLISDGSVYIIKKHRQITVGFVCHRDLSPRTEGHGDGAIEALSFRSRKKAILKGSHSSQAMAEKIPERHADSRRLRTIPSHLHAKPAKHARGPVTDGGPDPPERSRC